MKKCVKVVFRGTVTGIFYRQWIKENAEKLGIKGFARNLDVSNVEAWFEGESSKVDEMIEVCRTGYKHSKIKEVIVEDKRLQDFKVFKILRI